MARTMVRIHQRHREAVEQMEIMAALFGDGQATFQMATQIAFLERDDVLQALARQGTFSNDAVRALARIGLANYFAGTLLLPYGPFLEAAESLRYDIEHLGRRFGVGFETFAQPEKILTQLAQMTNGRAYLWMARTVSGGYGGYGSQGRVFSIGMGCKVCEREACPQRAFPFFGRSLEVNENRRIHIPYAVAKAK